MRNFLRNLSSDLRDFLTAALLLIFDPDGFVRILGKTIGRTG